MSVGRISTYALHQATLRNSTNVQENLANQQIQIASGQKSENFAGLGGRNTEQFLSLENKIARTNTYIDNNNLVATRLNTTDTVLSQITEIASSIKNLISKRRSDATQKAAFDVNINAQWQALAGQLNTNLQGRFLFSGTRTDTAPVDVDAFPTVPEDGVPNSDFYQGSPEDIVLRADDNITFTYNIRADDPAFQKMLAGLAYASQANAADSDADFQKAFDLVDQGLKGVISAQTLVNQNKVALDQINTRHKTFNTYFQGVKEEIGNSDIISLSTQVAINQGVLQAAFQTFAKINSLRLSDFLK